MSRVYKVNSEAVGEASAMLGLALPVRVFVRRYDWLGGRYIDLRDGVHRIGIASDLSPSRASSMLWHELTHALQVERLGSAAAFRELWWSDMQAAGLTRQQAQRAEGRAYRRTPLEAEANANERLHRQFMLTSRARDPARRLAGAYALRLTWR